MGDSGSLYGSHLHRCSRVAPLPPPPSHRCIERTPFTATRRNVFRRRNDDNFLRRSSGSWKLSAQSLSSLPVLRDKDSPEDELSPIPPPQTHTHTPQSRGRGRKSPVLCTPSPAGGTEGLRTTRRKTCTPADYCSVVSVSSAAVFPLASGISLAVRSRLVPGSGRRFKRPQTKPPPVNTTSLPGYPP